MRHQLTYGTVNLESIIFMTCIEAINRTALEVLKTGEGLPYVSPLCGTAIQQIIDIIDESKNVGQDYMEEFPTEFRMMQVISAS